MRHPFLRVMEILCSWDPPLSTMQLLKEQVLPTNNTTPFSSFPLNIKYFCFLVVCLDGTLPGYYLHRGYGSGANCWLVNLEVFLLIFSNIFLHQRIILRLMSLSFLLVLQKHFLWICWLIPIFVTCIYAMA